MGADPTEPSLTRMRAALDSQRKLGEANAAAMERVTRAAGIIERWLNPSEHAKAETE